MIKRIPIKITDSQKRYMGDELSTRCGNVEFKSKEEMTANELDIISEHGVKSNRVMVHARNVGDSKIYLVEDTNNLIVYRGRNWLLQRALNLNMTNRQGWRNRYISWFGVGRNGALSGSPLTPLNPSLENCQLGNHGTIGEGTNYVTVGENEYHSFDPGYPKILNDPDVPAENLCSDTNETDPLEGRTYPADKFLIGLVKVTIASNECNGESDVNSYQDINEAGLFVSPSNDLNYPFQDDDMSIFARVCFSTIRKDNQRELIFSWYLFF